MIMKYERDGENYTYFNSDKAPNGSYLLLISNKVRSKAARYWPINFIKICTKTFGAICIIANNYYAETRTACLGKVKYLELVSAMEGVGLESVRVGRERVGDVVNTIIPPLPDFRLQHNVEHEY